MKLKEKKKALANQVLILIETEGIVEEVGGRDGNYLTQIRRMASGENIRYDNSLNWVKIDFLYQYPEILAALNELSYVDAKLAIFGWIPWV